MSFFKKGDKMFKNNELIIDNFAGGGGASTGIEAAFKDITKTKRGKINDKE